MTDCTPWITGDAATYEMHLYAEGNDQPVAMIPLGTLEDVPPEDVTATIESQVRAWQKARND